MSRESGSEQMDRPDAVEDSVRPYVDLFPGRRPFSGPRLVEGRLLVDRESSPVVFEFRGRSAREEEVEWGQVSVDVWVVVRTEPLVDQVPR